MHCNLRSPDVVLVVLRFNDEAQRVKFQHNRAMCSWVLTFFTADTLCHAVTLTFDLLTLNASITSKYQISAKTIRELQRFKDWKFGGGPSCWIWPKVDFNDLATWEYHSEPANQVFMTTGRAWLSYWWFSEFYRQFFSGS